MNIKNEKAHRLAQELADLTGQSMTEAVTEAIQEKLNRVKNKGMAERIMKIARECAPLWKEPFRSADIDELLYDENGLPK
ncbi:MAG TPA: type II toxin-antitoxin system VapB family antitoxin [Terriglobales bacterium]|nr:type II toxin-antitoxin system VapB family antitoxin [Terriglobales bacterium]